MLIGDITSGRYLGTQLQIVTWWQYFGTVIGTRLEDAARDATWRRYLGTLLGLTVSAAND